MAWKIMRGDVINKLRELPDEHVQAVVTSPPYWGLRDYGIAPSIWGGDPDCRHEWGETIEGGEGYSSGQRKRWQHDQNRAENPEAWQRNTPQGQFCQKCGAWLGCHGLEPVAELYEQYVKERRLHVTVAEMVQWKRERERA